MAKAKAVKKQKQEDAVKQKLSEAVMAVIEHKNGKEKVLKKYKIRKSWSAKFEALQKLEQELKAEHDAIIDRMQSEYKEFWKLIEKDVKYDKKAAKKQNRCLSYRHKEGVVLLIENKLPDELKGIGAIIARGEC